VALSRADVVEMEVAESVPTDGAAPADAVTGPDDGPDEPELLAGAGQPSASSEVYEDSAVVRLPWSVDSAVSSAASALWSLVSCCCALSRVD